jgi:hypothetical protein
MGNAPTNRRWSDVSVSPLIEHGAKSAALLSPEETLRRLTIGDRALLAAISDLDQATSPVLRLEPRVEALVRLAVLIALDAPQSSYSASAALAFEAGATLGDLVATLLAAAGQVGTPRVVAAGPRIAFAAGYDVEAALEDCRPIPRWE